MTGRRVVVGNLERPDEIAPFELGESRWVEVAGLAIGRSTHEPGWCWSRQLAPMMGTSSCQVHHVGFVVSGRLGIRLDDGTEVEAGPNDIFDVPPGHDAWVVGDEPAVTIDVLGTRDWARPHPGERRLLTLLFVDIVDSTVHVARVGDARWARILGEHHEMLRAQLDRFGGTVASTAGDGILATFGSPLGAVRFGAAAIELARRQELELRIGIHTAEVERRGEELVGVGIHVANRVMAAAGPGEIYVSPATRALLAGAEVVLEDRGEHELKGVAGRHRLAAVTPA